MSPSPGIPAVLSLCIVSNRLTPLLEQIIRAVAGWYDEVLIGYDGPMHDIPERFRSLAGNLRIVPVSWEGYGTTKNKLAMQARNPWILSLDSDELPDERLFQSIAGLQLSSLPKENLYTFKRYSFFEGKKIRHGAWGRDRVTRLYHREATAWNQAAVHEALILQPGAQLLQLDGALLHYTADDYATFLAKNERYARLSAEKYFQKGKKSSLWKQWFAPAFTFIKEYVFQGGFLDGTAGYKIASINSRYTRWKYAFLKEKYQDS